MSEVTLVGCRGVHAVDAKYGGDAPRCIGLLATENGMAQTAAEPIQLQRKPIHEAFNDSCPGPARVLAAPVYAALKTGAQAPDFSH